MSCQGGCVSGPGTLVSPAAAAKAVNAAVQRDIASGNGIDIVTVTGDGVRKVLSKQIDTTITV